MKLLIKQYLKTVTLAIVVIFSIASCKEKIAEKDGFTINGNIQGLDNGWAYLIANDYTNRTSREVMDSTKIENGAFTFKGKVDHRDMVNVLLNDQYSGRFFIENSPIKLDIDLAKADKYGSIELEVAGSKSNDSINKMNTQIDLLFNADKYKLLEDTGDAYHVARKEKNDALMKSILKKMEDPAYRALGAERQKENKSARIDYILDNPSSPVATNVLGFQFSESRLNKEEMDKMLSIIDGEAKKTAFYKYYVKTYDEIYNSLGVGATVPDFTLTKLDGDPLTLSTVKGNYKLVDFWASWCVPCRASFPHLKELYKKYKTDGFEIVGIGTADEEAKWRNAIKEDQTPWYHVFDPSELEGKNQYGEVAKAYSVPFLPTTFLIDENDIIILRNPSKVELDNKLSELFDH